MEAERRLQVCMYSDAGLESACAVSAFYRQRPITADLRSRMSKQAGVYMSTQVSNGRHHA